MTQCVPVFLARPKAPWGSPSGDPHFLAAVFNMGQCVPKYIILFLRCTLFQMFTLVAPMKSIVMLIQLPSMNNCKRLTFGNYLSKCALCYAFLESRIYLGKFLQLPETRFLNLWNGLVKHTASIFGLGSTNLDIWQKTRAEGLVSGTWHTGL